MDRQEGDLRKEVARVESKREWAVEFRGWVEELARFLEVKVSYAFLESPSLSLAH